MIEMNFLACSYLQHGSYPVISPLNETYPADFNLQRTEMQYIEILSDGVSLPFILKNPLPGEWYATVGLTGARDERIKQKVLMIY